MTLRSIIILASISSAWAQSCPPDPQPPTPDAADAAPPPAPPPTPEGGTAGARACANLAALGCAEGAKSTCAVVIDSAIASRKTDPRADCLAAAKSKADVRACCDGVPSACSKVDCP